MKPAAILFRLILFFFSACAFTTPTKAPDDKIAERITTAIAPQIGSKNIGAIVAIYNKGSLRFLSFGETVRGNKTPPTADSIFEIGSITKTFTGLMLSRSIDLARVTPSDTLDQFIKDLKNDDIGSISLNELITHRSGLSPLPCNMHYKDPRQPYAEYSETDLIKGLKECRLGHHPTQRINYSNWGMATLGYVLAAKQKATYESLLYELVLDPLNLDDTTITLRPDQKNRLAKGYDKNLVEADLWERRILDGQGAIKSSARDIIKYAVAYLHPEQTPLESSIRRSMQVNYENENTAIGYAWFVKKSGNIWHNGQTGGYYSMLKIYPKRDLAVLYLSNTSSELKCFIHAIEEVPCDPMAE